jgi:hypothetical protein
MILQCLGKSLKIEEAPVDIGQTEKHNTGRWGTEARLLAAGVVPSLKLSTAGEPQPASPDVETPQEPNSMPAAIVCDTIPVFLHPA